MELGINDNGNGFYLYLDMGIVSRDFFLVILWVFLDYMVAFREDIKYFRLEDTF